MDSIELFKNLFSRLQRCNATEAKDFRKKYFGNFEKSGLPDRLDEGWKYTSLKSIKAKSLSLAPYKKDDPGLVSSVNEISISCLNGFFDINQVRDSFSPYNVEVLTISEALMQKKIRTIDVHEIFFSLNNAFYENGLFLSIPEGVEILKPVIIKHKVSSGSNFINPKIYIEMNKESSLEISEIFSLDSQEYFLNSSLQTHMDDRSSLKLLKHYDEKYVSSHIDSILVEQKTSTSFQFIQFSSGSQLLRQNLNVFINGKNSSTDLRGITVLENTAQMDNYVKIHHLAPESKSRQSFRSVLKDESHYVFQGNIRIEKDAQKTDSDQVNRNLMLGSKCRVDTKPRIDVFADDVKATHGAAIGQLSADEKFYLESRGISPDLALRMLYEGFSKDLLEGLKSQWMKAYLDSYFKRSL